MNPTFVPVGSNPDWKCDCLRISPRHVNSVLWLASASLLAMCLTGCGTSVFQSSFNSNPVGGTPSPNQATGTIQVSGGPGAVTIVSAPPNNTGNWAQIQRRGAQDQVATMQCNFAKFQQDGTYSMLAVMFIPSSSGLATVEFDTSPQGGPPSQGFLHLDFMQNNTVRINDDNSREFGHFPRDQAFTLAANLAISSSAATAHIDLLGTASGSQDINLVTSTTPLFLARQFGAVKFFMGFPWTGSFDVTDIVITRK
jgi:hypothetical protein